MKWLLFIFVIICGLYANAQNGKLLLIGGGGEKDSNGSWNEAPYKWAVEKSANKKVAVVSYNSESDWIPDYFKNVCGAVDAINIRINSGLIADADETYEQLMSCDVIFFKGGDQYNYYSTYKGTKTEKAVIDKYNQGGIICGTSAGLAILGGVDFVASAGSAYPDVCLKNPLSARVALDSSFVPFVPGYIFDTHFVERARFGRLVAFMANWKLKNDENLIGVGVDDMTAMTIEDNIGTVYGTGAINIYKAKNNSFSVDNDKLTGDSIVVSQLLHACTYNFETGEITGFSDEILPETETETGNYTLFMSGSDNLYDNVSMLEKFYKTNENPDGLILIITGSDKNLAEAFSNKLASFGATNVVMKSAISGNSNDTEFSQQIKSAEKILFVDNMEYTFSKFLTKGPTGEVLYYKLREDNMVSAFIGDNSRFAGAVIIENYEMDAASYYGNMQLKDGLNLMKTFVVMPKTFDNKDYYVNTASGVPYAMVKNKLRHGLWLNKGNYAVYSPKDGKTFLESYGDFPAMLIINNGTKGTTANQTSGGSGSKYRQIAGFKEMDFKLMNETMPYKTGDKIVTSIKPNLYDKQSDFNIYPNPVKDKIYFDSFDKNIFFSIYNITGNLVCHKQKAPNNIIKINMLPDGIYVVKFENSIGKIINTRKIIKQQ